MLINAFNIQKEINTKCIAENISNICYHGDVIAISGELGSGKSTFAKYFIKNLVQTKSVPSPSYNILLTYNSKDKTICHMDAWRLKNENEVLNLGITEMFEKSIFIIEWAEKIKTFIPSNALKLSIKREKNKRILLIEGNVGWQKRLEKLISNDE